jgi:predicted lipid-binding transport protein (Tim44 family)
MTWYRARWSKTQHWAGTCARPEQARTNEAPPERGFSSHNSRLGSLFLVLLAALLLVLVALLLFLLLLLLLAATTFLLLTALIRVLLVLLVLLSHLDSPVAANGMSRSGPSSAARG